LRRLPLTEVKIDRSYVSGIVDNEADRALITSVHELAQATGVVVVAEGVEDGRTAKTLASLPGTVGQGWHFGAPMRPDELRQHVNHEGTWARQ
jgi:EAL domain-containing protein (putative c-di-GMP-specific phosphodiesterase class I)